jgi:hypothetical protein
LSVPNAIVETWTCAARAADAATEVGIAVAEQHDPGRRRLVPLCGGRLREHPDRLQTAEDRLADRGVVLQLQSVQRLLHGIAIDGRRDDHIGALRECEQAEVDPRRQQIGELLTGLLGRLQP